MRRYRTHQLFVGAFLVGYVVLGSVFRFTRPNGEIFPVFAWTMFCYVPNTVTDYTVEVVELRGEPQSPPLPFHAARGALPGAGDIAANYVIQSLGQASSRGDHAAIAEHRAFFEHQYLRDENAPLRYRVVRRVFLPLDLRRSGTVLEAEPVADYSFGGSAS